MSVIQSLQYLSFASRVNQPRQTQQGLKPFLEIDTTGNSDFRRARDTLLDLYRNLEKLAELTNVDTRFKLDLPDARSTASLGLNLTATAAALSSIEEINTAPMSFSPFGPEWTGASDALVTIGGEYNGADGTDTLTLESRRNGTHGSNNLQIRVEDSLGNVIRNIGIGKNDPLDQQYDIGNGLYLTLGPGGLVNRDTTTIQVFDNVGASVDTSKPLGGARNDNPNLQFGITPVVNGSFQVNGQSINVSTTDSIDDIIDRINLSSAGVTASFNAATERVDFLQDTLGSAPTIDLQADTSNFLQALKLDGAIVLPGVDKEDDQALQDVAEFASVSSGDILVNGEAITIDTSSDSLNNIIDKINSSTAGVIASFDPGTQRVLIEAADASSGLELDSNGTGLFAALSMPEGRVDAEAVANGISRQRSYDVADATILAFAELSELFRDAPNDPGAGIFRGPLESAIREIFGREMSGELFGLRFDGSADARRRGNFASVDRKTLTRNLQLRGDQVKDILATRDGNGGLVYGLLRATRQALTNVNQALGISGTFIDTLV